MDLQNPQHIAFGSEKLKLKLGNIELVCFILENGQRIISKDSIQKGLGYDGKSENWLLEFLLLINRNMPVDPVLLESLGKNILFQLSTPNGLTLKYGTDPALFIEACQVIVKAKEEGFLYASELKFAKAAETVLQNAGNATIEKRIDFSTGFDLHKHNHKEALIRYMKKASSRPYAVWIKSFPDGFFETVFAFRDWTWRDLNTDAGKINAFLNDVIFFRIDEALLAELETVKPKMTYRKKNMPETYLEHPKLKAHIQSISALIKASGNNRAIFEQLLNKTFPKNNELKNVGTIQVDNKSKSLELPVFNENLKKALNQKKNS